LFKSNSKGYGKILELQKQFQDLNEVEAFKQLIFNLYGDVKGLYQLTDKNLVVQAYGTENDKFTTIHLVSIDILPAIEMLYFKNSNEERVRFHRSYIKPVTSMNLYEKTFFKGYMKLFKNGLTSGVY